jgi:acyl-coenzyme A synthetase/AMP-(fatty) acid ligase
VLWAFAFDGNADRNSDDEELPRAYIVAQSPERATAEVANDIRRWLAERVSKAKRLEGGVHFLEAIPKNPVSQ